MSNARILAQLEEFDRDLETTTGRDTNRAMGAGALWKRQLDDPLLAACRTHEIDDQILKQMESTSAFSATKFFLAGNLDSFVSPFG